MLELNRWDPFNVMATTKQLRCLVSADLPGDWKFVMQSNIWSRTRVTGRDSSLVVDFPERTGVDKTRLKRSEKRTSIIRNKVSTAI